MIAPLLLAAGLAGAEPPARRSYGSPPNRVVVKGKPRFTTLTYARYGRTGDDAPRLSYTVHAVGNGVTIEADADSGWKPTRPAWSYARGPVVAVDVTVLRPSADPQRPAAAPTVRRTLTGTIADELVELVNSLPAEREHVSLGCRVPAPDSLAIRTDRGTLDVSAAADCSSSASITAPGRTRIVFVDDESLNATILHVLGLPDDYGLN